MSDIVIRDLEPADVDAVVEIAIAAWAPIYAWCRETMGEELFAAAHPDWRESKAANIRRACDPQGPMIASVAEKEGRIAGFITFHANAESGIGELGNNAVHPDFQRMGIGSKMYQHALARLKQLGMRFVMVVTGGDPAHAPARRAYEKAGFTIQLPSVRHYREL